MQKEEEQKKEDNVRIEKAIAVHNQRKEVETQIAEKTAAIREQLKKKISALYEERRHEDVWRTIELMKSMTGENAEYYQQKLDYLIRMDQVDEVLDMKKMIASKEIFNWNPDEQINSYIKSYNEGCALPLESEIMIQHMDFVRWVKQNKGNLRKTKLKVYAPFYRGVHATVDIKQDEILVSSPIDFSISAKNLENTEIGKKLIAASLFTEHWRKYLFPIICVMEEWTNPTSFYKPWLDIISKRGTSHPMFFTESSLKWLQGSHTLDQLQVDKKNVEKFYNDIVRAVPEFAGRHSNEDFLHCYYVLCSRFFGLREYGANRAFLIPYSDMLNTGSQEEKNATWEYDSKKKEFQLKATAPIKKGDALSLYYGHTSNFIYFTYYGLALPGEEFNAVGFVMPFDESKVTNASFKAKYCS